MIVDDHLHISHEWLIEKFGSIEEYVALQSKNGVRYMLANSMDVDDSKVSLRVAEQHNTVLAAIGMYPLDEHYRDNIGNDEAEFIPDYRKIDQDISWIKGNASKAVAIGEVGLDNSNPKTHKEAQRYVFSKMIDIAVSKNMPIIIHSRKAEQEVLEMLEEKKPNKVVLHCFTGKKNLIKTAVDKGYYLSIPTSIVRSQHFQMMVGMSKMSRIITETDAPFMSPFKDDNPNESRFITESLAVMSKIKQVESEEMKKIVFQNFQRLYL